jgi:hypothetical protein
MFSIWSCCSEMSGEINDRRALDEPPRDLVDRGLAGAPSPSPRACPAVEDRAHRLSLAAGSFSNPSRSRATCAISSISPIC